MLFSTTFSSALTRIWHGNSNLIVGADVHRCHAAGVHARWLEVICKTRRLWVNSEFWRGWMGVPWTALTFDSVKGGRGVLRVEGGAQLQFPHLLTDVEALGQRILLFGHHHRVLKRCNAPCVCVCMCVCVANIWQQININRSWYFRHTPQIEDSREGQAQSDCVWGVGPARCTKCAKQSHGFQCQM